MPPKPCPTRDPLHFRIAMRETFGAASLRTSRRLTLSSSVMEVTPVTLPPGRERLATSPCSTGSSDDPITIGIVLMAALAAMVSAPAVVRMRSTFNWTNSVARAGRRSSRNSAQRRSTTMFCPCELGERDPLAPHKRRCSRRGVLASRLLTCARHEPLAPQQDGYGNLYTLVSQETRLLQV